MKARFIASIIFGIFASSAAQAGSVLTVEETYSASTAPQIAASKYDVASYYQTVPAQLQQVQLQSVNAALTTQCTWQEVKHNLDPLHAANSGHADNIESRYVGDMKLVC